jgi:hypothetical protein
MRQLRILLVDDDPFILTGIGKVSRCFERLELARKLKWYEKMGLD